MCDKITEEFGGSQDVLSLLKGHRIQWHVDGRLGVRLDGARLEGVMRVTRTNATRMRDFSTLCVRHGSG